MTQVVDEVKRQLPDVRVEVTDQFNFEYAEVSVRLTDPSGAKLHTTVAYDFYNEPGLWPALLPMQVGHWSCHCHNPTQEGDDRWA